MENTDSYPVFHTRLAATMRRRGSDVASLVLGAAERVINAAAAEYGGLAIHDGDRPSIPRQLRRAPGACCPVPGCDHRHDPGDGPPLAVG